MDRRQYSLLSSFIFWSFRHKDGGV